MLCLCLSTESALVAYDRSAFDSVIVFVGGVHLLCAVRWCRPSSRCCSALALFVGCELFLLDDADQMVIVGEFVVGL